MRLGTTACRKVATRKASLWVSHRSLNPPPNCIGGTADGLAGCNAARARFAPIDYRWLTDKNYWFGWNSL